MNGDSGCLAGNRGKSIAPTERNTVRDGQQDARPWQGNHDCRGGHKGQIDVSFHPGYLPLIGYLLMQEGRESPISDKMLMRF